MPACRRRRSPLRPLLVHCHESSGRTRPRARPQYDRPCMVSSSRARGRGAGRGGPQGHRTGGARAEGGGEGARRARLTMPGGAGGGFGWCLEMRACSPQLVRRVGDDSDHTACSVAKFHARVSLSVTWLPSAMHLPRTSSPSSSAGSFAAASPRAARYSLAPQVRVDLRRGDTRAHTRAHGRPPLPHPTPHVQAAARVRRAQRSSRTIACATLRRATCCAQLSARGLRWARRRTAL